MVTARVAQAELIVALVKVLSGSRYVHRNYQVTPC